MISYILCVSIIVHFLYMFHIVAAEFDPYAYKFIAFKIFNVHNGDDAFLEFKFAIAFSIFTICAL